MIRKLIKKLKQRSDDKIMESIKELQEQNKRLDMKISKLKTMGNYD